MQCPFCESQCTPAEIRFLADDTLQGDPVLGPKATVRFRPIHFTPEGRAVAPDGSTSMTPACPSCRAAWHPALRVDPTPPLLAVGPSGITAAIAAAETGEWMITRDDLPTAALHSEQASLVTCTQSHTAMCFVLTTRVGAVSALADALAHTADIPGATPHDEAPTP